MRFVDAHIHLSDQEYNGKVETIIEDAQKSNVIALVSNSMNYESSMLSLQLAEQNPGLVYAALGIHPWNVQLLSSNELEQTLDLIFKQGRYREKVVAIGEVGLDFSYGKKQIVHLQIKVFNEMLQAAEKQSFTSDCSFLRVYLIDFLRYFLIFKTRSFSTYLAYLDPNIQPMVKRRVSPFSEGVVVA